MRVTCTFGLLAAVLVSFIAAPVAAQSTGPIAVPIVGSPAAQRAVQPPVQPSGPVVPPPVAGTPGVSAMPVTGAQAERKLQLSVKSGLVTLVAQNVTVREVLTEWHQRTGCQFVNAEKLTGGPVNLEFSGRPELEVIDSLLRGAAGYMVGPPANEAQTGSICGAVYILASSRPTVAAGALPTSSSPIMAAPFMTSGSPDDEIPPVSGIMGMPPPVVQPRPGQPIPGQQPPSPNPNAPPPPASGFGPVAPTAPGAGRINAPTPPIPAPGTGRGGGGL
jgi:hypothetical protein